MSWIKTTAALAVGLALVACSKQEPQALQSGAGVNTINTTSTYTGPRETVSLSLQAGFGLKESESEARALEGSVFYRGRLRPKIEGNKANILLFLGSTQLNVLDRQELEFDYNEETNSVHYRGNMNVPAGLLQAPDLKMLLVVANKTKINDATLTMSGVKSDWFENKVFADGEKLSIDVPYFSEWLDVAQYVSGTKLDVARTKVKLLPQGHVIKVELSSSITTLPGAIAKELQVESTAITDGGTYTLPALPTDIGTQPVFAPTLLDPANKFHKFTIPVSQAFENLDNSKTRSIYVWVAPTSGATKKWTRTLAHVQTPNTILLNSFSGSWWDGFPTKAKKLYPVYYTNSAFDNTGSTMSLNVANTTIVSPIERFAYAFPSKDYVDTGDHTSLMVNQEPWNLPLDFGKRQQTGYSLYTWSWLENKGYVGDNAQSFLFSNAGDPNSRDVEFRIPTLEEFHVILPTVAPKAAARTMAPVQERVKLGNKNTPAMTYSSAYQYYHNVQGSGFRGMIGVRFMGGDDRYKTVYRYRALEPNNPGVAAMQVQTFYVGPYYPEIQTAQDFVDFQRNYPGATWPNNEIPVERILVASILEKNYATPSLFPGNRFWINKADKTNSTYVEYNYGNGTISLKEAPIAENQRHTVIVVRDLH